VKKIVSFCLWGNDPRYTVGALKNADLAKEIYPDWICRYYIGKSTPNEIITELCDKDNTELFIMNESGDWRGMFWRFLPASDSDVSVMISRDTDSRLSQREKEAVDQWLDSDRGFHIMRDHPAHGTEILGGMWGAKIGSIPEMKPLIADYSKGDFWQVDQNFLKEKIYPIVKTNSFVHDEFFEPNGNSFPRKRKEGIDSNGNPIDFIGEPVDQNDKRIW
tara:strand:+ start:355 stop:1011 length:657 start_codon:yes stop_codon:yes gene_type:complete